ncbi:MAG: shikimate dehydrogenase, partial [Ardenticatenaceae bacterium]|nr:shikimate dehydrogenase [Ardenticatenaceae bacterium]
PPSLGKGVGGWGNNKMKLSGKTRLLGLMGWPVSHSKSPRMQTAAAEAAGLDYIYVALPVHPQAVGEAVRGLPALGFCGVNVTVPHKQAVVRFLDEVDPAAAALGAVNTIVITSKEGHEGFRPYLKGYNTDARGFLKDLSGHGVEVDGRHCLVLGGGGSGRAVVYALATSGAVVHLLTRRPEQGDEVANQLAEHIPADSLHLHGLNDAPALARHYRSAIVVNTTPLGMTPNTEESVWQDEWPFPEEGFVYDLVYNPAVTRLMRQAQAAGLEAANGLGMLVHQGAEAFYLWTGVRPDLDIMRKAL